MLKCGLLGVGSIGKTHLKDAFGTFKKYNEPVLLEACFDLCEDNLKLVDCERKYTDLDEFFEKEKGKLDFVDICLPTFMHKEISERAMNAGFDVLCEKPIALCSDDAKHMCAIASETGRKLMIAHVLRFDREFMYLYDCIKNKRLGKVRNVNYTNYGSGLPKGQNNWFSNTKLSGGAVLDIHVHDTDLILWLFGMPSWVSAVAEKTEEQISLDSFSSNLVYDNGMYISIQCDWKNKPNRHQHGRSIRINCENGYIINNECDGMFLMVDSEGTVTNLKEVCQAAGNTDSMYYTEVKYFVDCLKNNSSPDKCLPFESAMAIKLIEAEIASAEGCGKKIRL